MTSRTLLSSRLPRLLLAACALALPFKAAGCGGRTACITLTQAQVAAGTCPTQIEATSRIVSCGSAVQSVDGPGALDGTLCCYPVTEANPNDEFIDCGFGGGTSFDSVTGISVSSGGPGGSPSTICNACNTALQGAPFNTVCSGTTGGDALQALRACGCATNCTGECDPTLCFGNPPDDACLACLNDACAEQLMTCQSN